MRYTLHRWRQDLKRDKDTHTRDLFYQRGCWWLYRMPAEESVGSVGWSVCIPGHHPGVSLDVTPTGDEPFAFHLGVLLGDLYLNIESRWLRRVAERLTPQHRGYTFHDDRSFRVAFHNQAVWWTIWMDDDEWNSTDPKWRRGSWHPLDTLLGSYRYRNRVLHTEQVTIGMPEGSYPATVTLSEATWKRPRWPWPRTVRRAEIEVANPPQFAGKGENSWDLDDDGIYSMTTPAATVDEAIAAYQASVARNRERYGMPTG